MNRLYPFIARRPAHKSPRHGAVVVEFAITVPILFAIVLGAIEFSRANMLTHTTAIAATEAARKAIIPGAVAADSKDAAMRELAIAGIKDATVELDPPVITDDVDQVTVNLTVPVGGRNGYTLARIFLGRELFKSVTLEREGKSVDFASESKKAKKDGMKTKSNSGSGSSGSNSGKGSSSS